MLGAKHVSNLEQNVSPPTFDLQACSGTRRVLGTQRNARPRAANSAPRSAGFGSTCANQSGPPIWSSFGAPPDTHGTSFLIYMCHHGVLPQARASHHSVSRTSMTSTFKQTPCHDSFIYSISVCLGMACCWALQVQRHARVLVRHLERERCHRASKSHASLPF